MSQPRTRVPLPVTQHTPKPYQGPDRETLRAKRDAYINPGVFLYYKEPVCIVEGHMQYLWDETGKRYLDGFAGIVSVSVGHCHPKVTARLREQVSTLVHATTIYLHPNLLELAERLAQKLPSDAGLGSTYFTTSGSEANELAVLMARLDTKRLDVITLHNGYHGGSAATMGMTAIGTWRFPVPAPAGTVHVPAPYCYRCPFGLEYPSCEMRCAHSVRDTIRYQTSGEVAAFVAESIQGVGGAVVPPKEYFPIVYEIVRDAGGLCVADEVQTGFGRTGHHYWGFENWGVTPDLVTMAKGIGNGSPLGACTTRRDIAENIKRKLHFNTFAGNPVSAAAGATVLEIIDEERIQQRALEVGAYLKTKLLELQERHPLIGDVRGLGLMLGVELVRDRGSKEPAGAETAAVFEHAKDRGLLIGKGGLFGNVLRIKPPMCLTKDDCDFLADCLDECLETVGKN